MPAAPVIDIACWQAGNNFASGSTEAWRWIGLYTGTENGFSSFIKGKALGQHFEPYYTCKVSSSEIDVTTYIHKGDMYWQEHKMPAAGVTDIACRQAGNNFALGGIEAWLWIGIYIGTENGFVSFMKGKVLSQNF